MSTHHFQVRKAALHDTRWQERPDVALAPGQVRVAVDRFALTANNITYAAFGDAMRYWDFFPTGEADWGMVPVWGFGHVLQSLHPGVAVGEQLYGYFPMATELLLQPQGLSANGFMDASPHRAPLHALYNRYLRCAADALHDPATADLEALLRPLFMTAWLIDDFLADNAWFGAAQPGARVVVLLSSASSKTAMATAHVLSRRAEVQVVGLTSPARKAYCEGLGCYHRVLAYASLDDLPADTACIYVDFAGNAPLRRQIHERFARLAYSCAVGGTHVQALGGGKGLPGPAPTLFFAPAQAAKRRSDWGAESFQQRLLAAWRDFIATATGASPPWLVVQAHAGRDAVAAVYQQVLAGEGDARTGHILCPRARAAG